jgi:hypothetical protein
MADVVESSPLFMRLLKHLTRSLARLLPAPDIVSAEAAVLARLTRSIEEERLFLDEPAALALLDAHLHQVPRSFSDTDVVQLQHDLASDSQADRALGTIMAAARRQAAMTEHEASIASGPRPVDCETGYLSHAILGQMVSSPMPASSAEIEFLSGGLGGLTRASDWFFAGTVLRNIVDRFQNGTDHGFVGTAIEEIYRTLYADKVGRFLWDGMKAKAAGAYASLEPSMPDNDTPGGTFFLQLLREYQEQHGADAGSADAHAQVEAAQRDALESHEGHARHGHDAD